MNYIPVELWRIFIGIGVVVMIRGFLFLREPTVGSAEIAGSLIWVFIAAITFMVAYRAKNAGSEAEPLRFIIMVSAVAGLSTIATAFWLLMTKG